MSCIADKVSELTVEYIKYIELKRVPYAIKDQGIRSMSEIGSNYIHGSKAKAFKSASEALYWLDITERLDGRTTDSQHIIKGVKSVKAQLGKKKS